MTSYEFYVTYQNKFLLKIQCFLLNLVILLPKLNWVILKCKPNQSRQEVMSVRQCHRQESTTVRLLFPACLKVILCGWHQIKLKMCKLTYKIDLITTVLVICFLCSPMRSHWILLLTDQAEGMSVLNPFKSQCCSETYTVSARGQNTLGSFQQDVPPTHSCFISVSITLHLGLPYLLHKQVEFQNNSPLVLPEKISHVLVLVAQWLTCFSCAVA